MPVAQHHYYSDCAYRAKTVCTSHVLHAIGIDQSTYHYSGTERQMLAIARRYWSLRSVKSRLGKEATVGSSRRKLAQVSKQDPDIQAYVVFVRGHVMLLDASGSTVVDTDPRKRDTRTIRSVYALRNK